MNNKKEGRWRGIKVRKFSMKYVSMDSIRSRENERSSNIVASQSDNHKENVHRRGHYFLRLWHPRDEPHPPSMFAGAPYFIPCCFQHALRCGYVSSYALKWKYMLHVFLRQRWTEKYIRDTCATFNMSFFNADLDSSNDF